MFELGSVDLEFTPVHLERLPRRPWLVPEARGLRTICVPLQETMFDLSIWISPKVVVIESVGGENALGVKRANKTVKINLIVYFTHPLWRWVYYSKCNNKNEKIY